jgi:quinol monooxygenase YgiN
MRTQQVQVLARVVALADKVEQLGVVLRGLVEPSRAHAGCIRYELTQNLADPTEFVFVEVWETEALLDAHLGTELLANAIAALDGLTAGPPDIRRLRQLA